MPDSSSVSNGVKELIPSKDKQHPQSVDDSSYGSSASTIAASSTAPDNGDSNLKSISPKARLELIAKAELELAKTLDPFKYNGDIKILIAFEKMTSNGEKPDDIYTSLIAIHLHLIKKSKVVEMIRSRIVELLAIELAKKNTDILEELIKGNNKHANLAAWVNDYQLKDLTQAELDNLSQVAKMIILRRQVDVTLPDIEAGPLPQNSATQTLIEIFNAARAGDATFSQASDKRNEIFVTIKPKNSDTKISAESSNAASVGDAASSQSNDQINKTIKPSREFNLTYLMAEADLTQLEILPPKVELAKSSDDKKSDSTETDLSQVEISVPTVESDELNNDEKVALKTYTHLRFTPINEFLRSGKTSCYEIKEIFLEICLIASAHRKLTFKENKNIHLLFTTLKTAYELDKSIIIDNDYACAAEILAWACDKEKITRSTANMILERKIIGSFRKSGYVPQGLDYAEGLISQAISKQTETQSESADNVMWSASGVSVREHSKWDHEHEALILHSQQFVHTVHGEVTIAHEVNTPTLQRPNDYAWLRALQIAHDEYLSKPYRLNLTDEDKGHYNIARPNHGLPHASRKLYYIDLIIAFYAKHYEAKKVRKYFKNLKEKEIEKIKCALAFYVTGRESEISWRENEEIVIEFRQQAVRNFTAYAKSEAWSAEDIETYADFLIHKSEYNDSPADWLHEAVSACHALDLMRCYSKKDMKEAMKTYKPAKSPQPQSVNTDWIALHRYASDCIVATGDRLMCYINAETGEYSNAFRDYDFKLFKPANLDVLLCQAMIKDVAKPVILNNPKAPLNWLPKVVTKHYAQHYLQSKTSGSGLFSQPQSNNSSSVQFTKDETGVLYFTSNMLK